MVWEILDYKSLLISTDTCKNADKNKNSGQKEVAGGKVFY